MQTYIIQQKGEDVYSYLIGEDTKTIEIHREKTDQKLHVGDILIGRVQSVAWNIAAAFVDVGQKQCCYMALDDLKSPFFTKKGASPRLQQGDELVLQVIREPIKTKAAALGSGLSIKGRYLVLTTGNKLASVSQKLPKADRIRLKEIALSMVTEEYGIVMRTNAAACTSEQLQQEYELLKNRWEHIKQIAPHRPSGTILEEAGAGWLRKLSSFTEEGEDRTVQIITDNVEIFNIVKEYLAVSDPNLSGDVMLYQDEQWPLEKRYSLEDRLRKAIQEKVYLRSGAYLMIQPTEALTAVDVNSGNIGPGKLKNKREETFLKVNLEAAKEIARQIRLRGISGMILVDFINMEEESSRTHLLQKFQEYMRDDPQNALVVDMTKLGLVEVTRRKTENPLVEQIKMV